MRKHGHWVGRARILRRARPRRRGAARRRRGRVHPGCPAGRLVHRPARRLDRPGRDHDRRHAAGAAARRGRHRRRPGRGRAGPHRRVPGGRPASAGSRSPGSSSTATSARWPGARSRGDTHELFTTLSAPVMTAAASGRAPGARHAGRRRRGPVPLGGAGLVRRGWSASTPSLAGRAARRHGRGRRAAQARPRGLAPSTVGPATRALR